jgi:hypothetical protein
VFDSNEVRVSLLVNVDDDTARPWATILTRRARYLEKQLYRRATTRAPRYELARHSLSPSSTKTWLRERSPRG